MVHILMEPANDEEILARYQENPNFRNELWRAFGMYFGTVDESLGHAITRFRDSGQLDCAQDVLVSLAGAYRALSDGSVDCE